MKINYKSIKTLEDLQFHTRLLKADYKNKELMLVADSKNYIKQYSIINMIKRFTTPSGFQKLDEQTHISGKIMSIILPMVLNKTIFRGSGLVTKAIGALVSGKIGKSLDAESISSAFQTVKSLFSSKKKDKSAVKLVDYGIPPDSETY